MANCISRRSFLRDSALAAGTAALAANTLGGVFARSIGASAQKVPADVAVVSGSNYYDATVRAVELMGGMKRFVPPGARVGLLVNSRFTKPGTFVKPEITLAVIMMCHHAGAVQIVSLEDMPDRYWRRATLSHVHRKYLDGIQSPRAHRTVPIPGGMNIKQVDVVPDLLECDVYINMPIFKDHEGTWFTGALKNLMGAISSRSNQTFHLGSDPNGDRDDFAFLSQSIADANLLRTPALSVGDATEILVAGGPVGPGPVRNFRTVVASTDLVALDACGAGILGYRPEDVPLLRHAQEHGVGTTNLDTLTIVRESLGSASPVLPRSSRQHGSRSRQASPCHQPADLRCNHQFRLLRILYQPNIYRSNSKILCGVMTRGYCGIRGLYFVLFSSLTAAALPSSCRIPLSPSFVPIL
jgi:uncharacterized protein (DUF362 family)